MRFTAHTSSCCICLAASNSWTRLISCFSFRVVGVDVIYKTTFPFPIAAAASTPVHEPPLAQFDIAHKRVLIAFGKCEEANVENLLCQQPTSWAASWHAEGPGKLLAFWLNPEAAIMPSSSSGGAGCLCAHECLRLDTQISLMHAGTKPGKLA